MEAQIAMHNTIGFIVVALNRLLVRIAAYLRLVVPNVTHRVSIEKPMLSACGDYRGLESWQPGWLISHCKATRAAAIRRTAEHDPQAGIGRVQPLW
jgi:hypothetical protein